MALRLADAWVWDAWYAHHDGRVHCFFLRAPRSVDPAERHWHAAVGHASSTDLRSWQVHDDALRPGPAGAWDDLTIWTGSVLSDGDRWVMLYTGCSRREGGRVQRIGAATSDDLHTWTRHAEGPVMAADGRWYERLDSGRWHDEAWRDPWLFADADGDGFHALVTARSPRGPAWDAGVVGHAWSPDLLRWEVRPPRCPPTGFGYLEVLQHVADRGVLLFSCDESVLPLAPGAAPRPAGTYAVPAASALGPYDLTAPRFVGPPGTYSGRVVDDPAGVPHLLAFRTNDRDGFVGEIADPIALDEMPPLLAARGAPTGR